MKTSSCHGQVASLKRTDNPKESAHTLLGLTSEFSQVLGYNVITSKSTECLDVWVDPYETAVLIG